MQFLRGAGTEFRFQVVLTVMSEAGEVVQETLDVEATHLPRLLVRRLIVRQEQIHAADAPKRTEEIEYTDAEGETKTAMRPTSECVLQMHELLREIIAAAVIRVHGLRVGDRDGGTIDPAEWAFEGKKYRGAAPDLVTLIEDADALETIGMSALGSQRPTVIQGKSFASPPPVSPEISRRATPAA